MTDIRRVHGDDERAVRLGSARAVAAGEHVLVAGTLPLVDGLLVGEGDPYTQTRTAFAQALAALGEFGLGVEAVVRTRTYLTHERDVEEVERAHHELFAEVSPAATLLVVAGLGGTRALVQVELEAYAPGLGRPSDTAGA